MNQSAKTWIDQADRNTWFLTEIVSDFEGRGRHAEIS
jgi:hypothetical protein